MASELVDPSNGINSFLHCRFRLHCFTQVLEVERKMHFLDWEHGNLLTWPRPLPPSLKGVQVLGNSAVSATVEHSVGQRICQSLQLRILQAAEGLPNTE